MTLVELWARGTSSELDKVTLSFCGRPKPLFFQTIVFIVIQWCRSSVADLTSVLALKR